MEMMIIAVIALVAFAAVLIPLFRRPAGPVESNEFEGDVGAPAKQAGKTAGGRPRKSGASGKSPASGGSAGGGPASKARRPPHGATPPASGSVTEADPVHGEGVVPPMAAGPVSPVDASFGSTGGDGEDAAGAMSDDELELEVQRYRAAVRAGTVCSKCGQANPADSSFCFDCGAALPLAEAREFE